MLVRKKYMVQKSFRIDRDLETDIAILGELTNRSQNDLVNNAIQSFLIENKIWFIDNCIVEHYQSIFDYTGEEYEPIFEISNVRVNLQIKDGFYKVHYIVKDKNDIIEDYTKSISISEDNSEDKLKRCLRYISSYINTDCDEVEQYLKERLDYRDFIPVKKK